MSLKERVDKILEARRIQKKKIDQASEHERTETELFNKKAKPIKDSLVNLQDKTVTKLDDLTRAVNLQPATTANFLRQELTPALENIQASIQGPQEEEVFHDSVEESVDAEELEKDLWVQNLYQSHRKQSSNRTTSYEVDLNDGKIGENGSIDIESLFNNNELKFTVDGKRYSIELTEGLAALLLLPYQDLKDLKITPNDIKIYRKIMQYSGYKSSVAKKYTEYLKKEGKGIFYNDPKQLEDRLALLNGSINAGNTSTEMKSEIRSIVDELLRIKYICPKMHSLLYQKFRFI